MVSVEENEILKTANDLKRARMSVNAERTYLKNCYYQTMSVWKDKKNAEFGNVINEVNLALIRIEKIFAQTERSLYLLLKAIRSYEEVRLTGGTAGAGAGGYESGAAGAGVAETFEGTGPADTAAEEVACEGGAGSGDAGDPSEASGPEGGRRGFLSGLRALFSGAGKEKEMHGMKLMPHAFKEGMWEIKGNCYDSYMEYCDHSSEYTGVDCNVVEYVDPCDIEGVYLSDYDVENPDRFWGMHASHDENMDTFLEIASHIPEVRARLGSGESLESLKNDDVLGKCACLYFDPHDVNAVRIERGNGFYRLGDSGRHRVIAARLLGHSFPVLIVSDIVRRSVR